MKALRKKIYVAAGYNTTFFGSGRKEFNPNKPMPTFESYIQEAAKGSLTQLKNQEFDEGVICNFMAPRFIKQANLPGFLPFVVPSLLGKPCTGLEGACGSGGRALATAARILLSDAAESVFVLGFEIQNTVKAVYGADILAGASYFNGERKQGYAHFFPGIFSARAGAYYEKYGQKHTREALARWYERMIQNARKNPKAQEYHNEQKDLFSLGMTPPDADRFVPCLNAFDCSKVTDGASALVMVTEEGLKKLGIPRQEAIEVIGIGAAEGDITKPPQDPTYFANTAIAGRNALEQAGINISDVGVMELHDCFTVCGLLAIEALGLADKGKAPEYVLNGIDLPINQSGGLCGFGHPVGATGVRQMVDLQQQLTGKAPNQANVKHPYGMMVSMGGNDITVTAIVTKK